MGLGGFCLGQPSPDRLPKEETNDHPSSGFKSSVIEFMKLGCIWRKNEIKKRHVNPQEQRLQSEKEFSTLRECILSSSVLNNYGMGKEDEFNVFKPLSTKVHPSLLLADNGADYAYGPRSSFSKERLLWPDQVYSRQVHVSPLGSSGSGKAKKKVSFRLPEEADIFVYNPLEAEEEKGE